MRGCAGRGAPQEGDAKQGPAGRDGAARSGTDRPTEPRVLGSSAGTSESATNRSPQPVISDLVGGTTKLSRAKRRPRAGALGRVNARERAHRLPQHRRGPQATLRDQSNAGASQGRRRTKGTQAKRKAPLRLAQTGHFISWVLAQPRRASFARPQPRPGLKLSTARSIADGQFCSSINCAGRCPRLPRGRGDCQVASCSLRWLLIRW